MSRVRESVIEAYRSQGTKFCFYDYFLDDEPMSTGIVSSKEGHYESHIDDMKTKTTFWNVVDDVTIGLTQKVLTQMKFLITKENFQLPFEHQAT